MSTTVIIKPLSILKIHTNDIAGTNKVYVCIIQEFNVQTEFQTDKNKIIEVLNAIANAIKCGEDLFYLSNIETISYA